MKFGNLLKKELKELITVQALVSMIFTMVLLIVMGQIMGGAMAESFDTSEITLCNQDDSEFTATVLKKIDESQSTNINYVTFESDDYAAELERLDIKNAVIIPQGYGESLTEKKEPAQIRFVSVMSSSGFLSTMSSVSSSDVIDEIQTVCMNELMSENYGLTEQEIELIREPMTTVEYTVHNGRTARIPVAVLSAITMMQSFIAPFAIFFLLMMASQMIMTAISTEKIDKTLETLLSAPVSRMTVLSAKMVAAVISALLNALFMIVGFALYMVGMMGSAVSELSSAAGSMNVNVDPSSAVAGMSGVGPAMAELGLTLTPLSYVLFAVQLFLTLAIGLAISLILGAMATDVKSVQTLTMPIMIAVMIPFFVTMFMDVSAMSPVFKIIVYAIPFTHTYTALTNLMNGDMIVFWGGLAYQAVFFAVCMFLAVRMFTTDRLFTMSFSADSLNKKKGKNKNVVNE
ncbi:MAG: ABC transporter permease [Ruminococcus sp.]|nr:ABC transporter permease [Ruminococcus sp.]MCM1381147.1 ABC transporter permease [Muribaculaceae bacterium]MCM1478820.1 ABC transporter permease [Muribaculaceae bacterium]